LIDGNLAPGKERGMEKNIMEKKTLVLGASLKPSRYSNIAIKRLASYGHPVVAVGLRKGEVAGVSITNEMEDFQDVDTITLYLNPQRQKEYYDYIISLQPERVIFNPGTENSELYSLLKKNNIEIEVACTLVMLSTNQY
jgi:uncharacterized protein